MAEIVALLLGACLEPTTPVVVVVVVNTLLELSRSLLAKLWTSSSRRPAPQSNEAPLFLSPPSLDQTAFLVVFPVALVELVALAGLSMEPSRPPLEMLAQPGLLGPAPPVALVELQPPL
jgi:hypothetical protein